MRYDIISDTHGFLSEELLDQLQGTDVIVHAGDVCSLSDIRTLEQIAPLKLALGNNDYSLGYGSGAVRRCKFFSDGFRWQVCHYRERLDTSVCDIAICGHTHRPYVERDRESGTLIMNPGSPTYPRAKGPSMGRIIAENGKVLSAEIITLDF